MLDTLAYARPFYAFVPASAAHAKARSQAAGAVLTSGIGRLVCMSVSISVCGGRVGRGAGIGGRWRR
jgi:hypothetical protein